jgi:hypothetical protein
MPDLMSPPVLDTGAPSPAFGGIESTGFRLEFISMEIGAGMTILIEGAIYKQTLSSNLQPN